MYRLAAAFLAAILCAAVPALAQEAPPARVGRVSLVQGQLAFHLAGETQWSGAAVNYPAAAGGSFWVDPQSKAEIRVGTETISLAPNTELDIVKLDEQVMQLSLPQGRIEVHLRQLGQGQSVEIDVARGGVWLLRPGIYDIDAGAADQPTRITAFEGQARFVGGATEAAIDAGQAAVISGTQPLSVAMAAAARDAFAEWCSSRDYHENRLATPYYVAPAMTGSEELDQYGSWNANPQFGQVWYPTSVAADWAPYRDGRWVWVQPWGWTWVDAQPWGFAPFHYGRWARINDRWGWVPGRFERDPVYAPALVAFIGGGGVGFGGGPGPAVGWFPLAPDEVYWPTYTRDARYIRNVNITNVSETRITNITNVIARQRTAGPPPQFAHQAFANRAAATVVPVRAFASAASVAPAALHVAPQTLQKAPVSVRPPQVRPVVARPAVVRPAGAPPATAPIIHPPGVATAPATGRPGTPTAPPGVRPGTAAGVHLPPPAHAPPVVQPQTAPAAGIHPPPPAHAPPVAQPQTAPAVVQAPPPARPAPVVQPRPAPAPVVHAPPPPRPAPVVQPRPAPAPVVHAPPPRPAPVVQPRPAPAPVVHAPPPPRPAPVAQPRPAAAPPAAAAHGKPPAKDEKKDEPK
ncbi:MAG TPA: DUF6600 domain-containing protein [Stellaceae bacterium]|nr:DUF6600 domain-containing protein [Stellaceae bacterium]